MENDLGISCPTPAQSPRGDLPEQLGDYRILRYLGEGGMGIVYEAVRESLRSHVALKVMHRRFRDREAYLRRFRTEARSAARLHHTNIVSVFDYGVHDGVCYYAMQYIAGHSLDKVLDDLRQLRQEKNGSPVAATVNLAYGQDGPTGLDRGEIPHRVVRPMADSPRQTVTLGLLTGQWSKAPQSDGSHDGDTPALPGASVMMRGPIEDAEPMERGAAQLAVEMCTTLDGEIERGVTASCAPRPDSVDARGSEPSALSGSTRTLTGKADVRYYREVARLGVQVADALAHAHGRGVVHRDIKPPNLLLDPLGHIWITDFGLAKFQDGGDVSESEGAFGTLRYMAPERFRGVTTARCDLYALGATLYEMLTLRPPFEGQDQIQLLQRIQNDPPVPPRQIERGIPQDLETIVLKALAKDPDDRFASAEQMAEELRLFQENRPLTIRPIPAYQRFWRWCQRNPKLAAANILAAVLTTLLAIVSTVAAVTYRTNMNRALKAERKGRLELGKSFQAEGAALQRTGRSGQRLDSLDRLRLAAQILGADPEGRKRLPQLRNQAITALGLVDLREGRRHDCGDVFGVGVDAPFERYAFVERSGEVVVRRLDDDRELVRLPGPVRRDFSFARPGFNPDGELLIAYYWIAEGDLVRIWHLGRRELLGSLSCRHGTRFHPDGRHLVFGAPEGGIAIWDLDERRVVRRLPLEFAPYEWTLDPEGRRFAMHNGDQTTPRVAILELETGRVLAEWKPKVGLGSATMAWSADGQLLAVAGAESDPRVYVWNVRRGALQSVLEGHISAIVRVLFAHSGYLLATASWDGTTRLWDAASGDPLAMAEGVFLHPFSSDNRRLAFANGGTIGVWDVATAPECRTLHAGVPGNRAERREALAGVHHADFSPDGRLVATGAEDGVRLWEADTGRELAHLQAGSCESVLFHPKGESLISYGKWGPYRWPIRPDPVHGPDAIRVGPPELLRETTDRGWYQAAWLPDHRTLALVENAHARVLLVDSTHPHPAWSRAVTLDAGGNHRMTSISVSRDGRWLAVGGWYEAGVRVWDLPRRRLERVLRPKDAVRITRFWAGFSADGRWLIAPTVPDGGQSAYDFWRAGTWDLDHRIYPERGAAWHPPVFSGDGRLMALAIATDQVLLADAATGRELARLTTLQRVSPTPFTFSPDGTRLVAFTEQRTALLWDLRRIRDQLAPMGLDWDAPPYPVASAASEASGSVPPPRPVRVVGEVIEPRSRCAADLAEMNRRLATNPDDAEALIHRGWLRLAISKAAESAADLERALRLRPDDVDARYLLAQAYGQANNPAAERATLETYLARSADDTDARLRKGLVALQLGRLQEAADDFTKVLDADPGRDAVRHRRSRVWFRLGRFQEALADLDPLIQRHPQDPILYDLRSEVHDRLGHREQAQADRKRAVESPLADAQQYNNQAWRLANGPAGSRDPEQALALAQKAVALAPGTAIYLNTLGVVQYRAGHYAKAITTLEKSLAASKGESDAFDLFFLAMARSRLGQIAQARADFDRAIRWRRDHPKLAQPGWSEELDAFQAEAESVLAGPVGELPADVFAGPQ